MTETIIERLKKMTERNPDAICYDDGTQQYSFELLMQQSDKVASYLNQQTALTKKAPILVFGGLQFEMLITFLGCMKAGHAYIPVDGHTPSERLEQIISIAKPAMVISIEDLSIALEAKQLKIDKTTFLMCWMLTKCYPYRYQKLFKEMKMSTLFLHLEQQAFPKAFKSAMIT